jgi:hypothetical protein
MMLIVIVCHSRIGISTVEIYSYTIKTSYNSFQIQEDKSGHMSNPDNSSEEKTFVEFRRKVRAAEVLSAAMERLLLVLQFTGRVSIVVQNGRVLKSGYEEGYFPQGGNRLGTETQTAESWGTGRG